MGPLLKQTTWSTGAVILGLLVVTQAVASTGDLVYLRVATLGLVTGMLVVALYVFSGNSGVVSFGHVAFFATGAYVSSWLTIPEPMRSSQFPGLPDGVPTVALPVAVLAAGGVSAVFAGVVGIPLMRLAGTTASVATLMLLLIVQIVASNWRGVTGGQQSVLGVPADVDITKAFVGMVVAILVAAVYQVTRSARRLRASREDEVAAAAVGIHVARDRWVAFVVSGFIAGMAGGMWTHVIGTYSALSFSLELTFMSVAMLIIGGMLSLTGAVTGVVIVTVLGEIPRHVDALPAGSTPFVVSLAMLAVLLLRPSGITSGKDLPLPRRRRAVPPPASAPPSVEPALVPARTAPEGES